MSDNRWDLLEALFSDALRLPRAERRAFLDARCGDDQSLLAEVLELLNADTQNQGLTSAVGVASGALADEMHEARRLRPGERINGFEIVGLLGSGGMGEVYEARQHEPVQRTVALKVMRHYLNSPESRFRFEAERQALALMDHPAIAKVFDAGQTDQARSYFAMELIDGPPIDRFVVDRKLSLKDLLRLYIRVCRGVEHAHQKGIIHRDLKPSNILIASVDDDLVPKVIDFGIAKPYEAASEGDLTQQGQVLGTPRYMSPEQADSLGQKADTRSDVYALGTVLYELLCDEHPLDLAALQSNSQAERQSAFERGPRAAPSQVLAGRGERQQAKALVGDLDAIVLKALEHDTGLRYRSAADFADDLQRFLSDQPVSAVVPRLSERFAKFYRRNRAAVLGAGFASFALLLGVSAAAVSYVGLLEAEQEAQRNAATAQSVSDFMVSLFDASDPSNPDTSSMTVRELLDLGAQRMDAGLETEPLTRIKTAIAIGRVYVNLGMHAAAVPILERALAASDQRELANADVVEALIALCTAQRRLERFEPGLASGQRAVELSERVLGQGDRRTGQAYAQLGAIQVRTARFEEAEHSLKRAGAILEAAAPGTEDFAIAMHNLAGVYFVTDRPELALPLTEEAIDVLVEVDERLPTLIDLYSGYGLLHYALGHLDQAAEALETALLRKRGAVGNDHFSVAENLLHLAVIDVEKGRFAKAIQRTQEAIAIQERSNSSARSGVIAALHGTLATALVATGELAAAESAAQQAIAVMQDRGTPKDPTFKMGEAYLAAVRQEQGRFDEARALFAQALAHRESVSGRQHMEVLRLIERIGDMELAAGEPTRAKALYGRALAAAQAAGIADRPQIKKIANAYAALEGLD